MRKILNLSFVLLLLLFIGCDNDDDLKSGLSNYVGIETLKNVGLLLDETKTIEAKVYATEVSSEDRTIGLSVNAASTHGSAYYNVPSSVVIPAGSKEGVFNVNITGTNIASTGNKLIVDLTPSSDYTTSQAYSGTSTDPIVSNSRLVINITEVCQTGTTRVKLSIKFDNYPEETAWELYDSNNVLVSSAGFNAAGTAITGFAALGFADGSTYTNFFCLAPGNYTFVIYDDYGDGMFTSATVQGTYSLKSLDDTVTYLSGGGNFGTTSVHEFTIQ